MGFPGGAGCKEPACQRKRHIQSLNREDPLEEGMATHSSILAWRIPWTEEPDRLQSIGLHRVWSDLARQLKCNRSELKPFFRCGARFLKHRWSHTVDAAASADSREWARSFGRGLFRSQQYHLFNYTIKFYPSDLKESVHIQLCLIYTLGRAGSGSM